MNSKYKKIIGFLVIVAICVTAYMALDYNRKEGVIAQPDPAPQNVTLSGTYVCLPHLDTTGPQTEECRFGLKADNGDYYAVNFGASANAVEQFQSGKHIKAEGFFVAKETLSSNEWLTYNMKGIFTITVMIEPTPSNPSIPSNPSTKLDINVVCNHSLTYMRFPTALMAQAFVSECKEGKHPEVIERYKSDMGLSAEVTI